MQITTIGLDIAKNVCQVHGIDAASWLGSSSGAVRCWPFSRRCHRAWSAGGLRYSPLLGA